MDICDILKVTGHTRIKFFVGFPPSVQDYYYITCTFECTSLRLFRFTQFVPFWIKNSQNLSIICEKGTNCEILNLILSIFTQGRIFNYFFIYFEDFNCHTCTVRIVVVHSSLKHSSVFKH